MEHLAHMFCKKPAEMEPERMVDILSENPILQSLEANPLTQELMKPDGKLGNLSEMEEALLLAAAFDQDQKTRIIVKKNKYEAQQLYARLAMLQQEVVLFVMDESLRIQAIAASPEEKNAQLSALVQMRQDFPKIIITNTAAFTRFLPDVQFFDENCIRISNGMEISRQTIVEKLNRMGYAKVNYAEVPCSYAVRGGILDVYSLNYPDPIRIEFFDTEIDSIRFFNPNTQRTIRAVDEVTLVPAADVLFTDEQIQTLQTNVMAKLEEQLPKTDPAGADFLRDAIEEDLQAISSYDPQSKLYRYYAWLDSSSILDYVPDAQIIYSPRKIFMIRQRKSSWTMRLTCRKKSRISRHCPAIQCFMIFTRWSESINLLRSINFCLLISPPNLKFIRLMPPP